MVWWCIQATPAHAQSAKIILTDGLIGAGLGAAFVTARAFSNGGDTEDAAEDIPAAAAIGAILGMALGSLEVAGAFAPRAADGRRLVWTWPRFSIDPARRAAVAWFEGRF